MVSVAIYDLSTGEIRATLVGDSSDIEAHLAPDEGVYAGDARDDEHWIDPDTGERRDCTDIVPTVIDVPGQVTISGLPAGAIAVINSEIIEIEGGELVLVSDVPAVLDVRFRAPRHFDHRMEVSIQ